MVPVGFRLRNGFRCIIYLVPFDTDANRRLVPPVQPASLGLPKIMFLIRLTWSWLSGFQTPVS